MALSITLTNTEAMNYISVESRYAEEMHNLVNEISELKAENSDLIDSFQQRAMNEQVEMHKSCSVCRFYSSAALTEQARCHKDDSPVENILESIIDSFYCSLYEPACLTE